MTTQSSDNSNNNVAERNIERLLGKAYLPETPSDDFVTTLTQKMCAAAGEHDSADTSDGAGDSSPASRPRDIIPMSRPQRTWRGWSGAVAAGILLGLTVGWMASQAMRIENGTTVPGGGFVDPGDIPGSDRVYTVRNTEESTGLTARQLAEAPADQKVAVGDAIQTAANQKRRVALPDGSILYVNTATTVTVAAERRIDVHQGEVFVDVAQQDGAKFVVKTPDRTLTALGTKFDVRHDDDGTTLVVTQGKVQVDEAQQAITAGQQLRPDAGTATAAPRATYALDWTRELMLASRSPLVPKSKHAGGALICIDPFGQETKLSMRKYHVDVFVQDGFARTTIDQTYFNHENRRLEGTFYFPLPPDASLSRLAMYVNGQLMEGGMAEREHARNVYESIVYQRKDPALLEWVDGSTFKMRVFPLEARQEKRIIISYTQKLASQYGQQKYRFPTGHSLELVKEWSFHARIKNGTRMGWDCPSHELAQKVEGNDLLLDASARAVKMEKDIVLNLNTQRQLVGAPPQPPVFTAATHEGAKYLMVGYEPVLPSELQRQRRDWVFLFESSAARDPMVARAQVEIVRSLLDHAEHDDTFNIVTAGTRAKVLSEQPLAATPANVAAAVGFMENSHLVGAMDLGQALATAQGMLPPAGESEALGGKAVLVHVGSGIPTLGVREEDKLFKMLREDVEYIGVGVGKKWSRQFMKQAAGRTGGYFTQINPDEDVHWRAYDLLATINSPRLLDVKIVDASEQATFLSYQDTIVQGEAAVALCRVEADQPLPESVIVTGTLDGEAYREQLSVNLGDEEAAYLPRIWAKQEIDRLLAEDAEANKKKIIELSKAMYVMSPYTSLLVLETEAMYAQFNVDRGRKDHWALYPAPEQIKVVFEPDPANPIAPRAGTGVETDDPEKNSDNTKPPAEQILNTILVRTPVQLLYWPNQQSYYGGNTYTVHQLRTGAHMVNNYAWQRDRRGGWGGGGQNLWSFSYNWSGSATGEGQDMNGLPMLGDLPVLGTMFTHHGTPRKYADFKMNQWAVRNETFFSKVVKDAAASGPAPAMDPAPEPRPVLAPPTAQPRPRPMSRDEWNGRFTPATPVILSRGLRVLDAEDASIDALRRISGDRLGLMRADGRKGFKEIWGEASIPVPGEMSWGDGSSSLNFLVDRSESMSLERFDSGVYEYFEKLGEDRPEEESESRSSERRRKLRVRERGQQLGWSIMQGHGYQRLQYQRPRYRNDWRTYHDLLAYAPGMNTNEADIMAVVTAEADTGKPAEPGRIDDAARKLIDGARGRGWEKLSLLDDNDKAVFSVVYDGQGRHRYEQTPRTGLREVVVCDGESLWHLYPQIGVGAKRGWSRYHQVSIRNMVPWLLPDVEQMALGFDVIALDERIVAVQLRGIDKTLDDDGKPVAYTQLHLLFADDGRLAERKLVRIDPNAEDKSKRYEVLYRYKYSADGTITLVDGAGKQWAELKMRLAKADAPNLTPTAKSDTPQPQAVHHEVEAGQTLSEIATKYYGSSRHWKAIADANAAKVREGQHINGGVTLRIPPRHEVMGYVLGDLVILDLPFRSRAHVLSSRKLADHGHRFNSYKAEDALALLASDVARQHGSYLLHNVAHRFHAGDRRVGYYTLLMSGQHNWDTNSKVNYGNGVQVWLDPAKDHPDHPLAQYVKQMLAFTRNSWRSEYLTQPTPNDKFLAALAELRVVTAHWQNGGANNSTSRTAARQRTLKFIRGCDDPYLGWAAMSVLQDYQSGSREIYRETAAVFDKFEDAPGLAYVARYEHARALNRSGDYKGAAKIFEKLYRDGIEAGVLPVIDHDFRNAMVSANNNSTRFHKLLRETADELTDKHGPIVAIYLAWQCRNFSEPQLGEELYGHAIAQMDKDNRYAMTLASVEYLWHSGQQARAERMLEGLLEDETYATYPELWQLTAAVTARQNKLAKSLRAQERAIDLAYADMPDVVNLQVVRNDHSQLLSRYEQLAHAVATLEQQPPQTLVEKVIGAADRWRALDTDDTQACQYAGRILRVLGEGDLAWDYMTTPLAEHSNESGPWVSLANQLRTQGDLALADRAFATAYEVEPTNAQVLWDRAQLLQQSGRFEAATQIYQQIANGEWQQRFDWIKTRAKRYSEGRN